MRHRPVTACLPISDRQVDLWLVPDGIVPASMAAAPTPAERMRALRFKRPEDRDRHLLTRALVRAVLSRYAAVAPADWRFTANRHGRPAIVACGADACGLDFNLSHTPGLIAMAVTRDRPVGIDVERVAPRTAMLDIADRYFAPAEAAQLQALPPAGRPERFYEHWTLKESYLKARGLGLSVPLARFGFDLSEPGSVGLRIEPDLGDDPGRWWFALCRPTVDHVLAVCAGRLAGRPPDLTVRRAFPLADESPVATTWLRRAPLLAR